MCESRHHGVSLIASIVRLLELRRWEQADGLEQAPVVEPVNPFECGELDRLEMTPESSAPDDLGLEEANHRFSQGVVVGVTGAADRGADTDFGQALAVADRQVLGASIVGVDHQRLAIAALHRIYTQAEVRKRQGFVCEAKLSSKWSPARSALDSG